MKIHQLFEAPIADISHYGDWSSDNHGPSMEAGNNEMGAHGNDSFISKIDRRMAQDPKNLEILTRYFRSRKEDFYIYFINDAEVGLNFFSNLDYGEIKPSDPEWDWFDKYADGDFREKVVERINDNSIQIILTHNDGGAVRHNLTPWMMVHRMAHALYQMVAGQYEYSVVNTLCRGMYETEEGEELPDWFIDGELDTEILKSMATFKSARDNNILNDSILEIFCEMFTQYIVKGEVSYRKPADRLVVPSEAVSVFRKDDWETYARWFCGEKSDEFERALAKCKGGIFVC